MASSLSPRPSCKAASEGSFFNASNIFSKSGDYPPITGNICAISCGLLITLYIIFCCTSAKGESLTSDSETFALLSMLSFERKPMASVIEGISGLFLLVLVSEPPSLFDRDCPGSICENIPLPLNRSPPNFINSSRPLFVCYTFYLFSNSSGSLLSSCSKNCTGSYLLSS